MHYQVNDTAQFDLQLDYRFSKQDVESALSVKPEDVSSPNTLTFSKNVFLPLTTACKYTCAYCVYYDVPGQESLLTQEEIKKTLDLGAKSGCHEALLTFGDTPDERYQDLFKTLKQWGYNSLHEYHLQACEWALEHGLLPHSNPGDMSYEQMADLREVNVSMGTMLETTADVVAHAGKRRKTPGQRLQTLEYAGRLKVPFTTGLLIGIGETWEDRAVSLLSLKRLHEAYGHIQEIIIQNVVPNKRWKQAPVSVETLRRVVAMARAVLPEDVEVQVPPNLSLVDELMDCGIGDLGGVSPITDDFINPDYQWPAIQKLEALAERHGKLLKERLAIYPQYVSGEWLSPRMERTLKQDKYQAFFPAAVGGPAHG